jgi:hypothetical protein
MVTRRAMQHRFYLSTSRWWWAPQAHRAEAVKPARATFGMYASREYLAHLGRQRMRNSTTHPLVYFIDLMPPGAKTILVPTMRDSISSDQRVRARGSDPCRFRHRFPTQPIQWRRFY